jgi:hypothetical protein
MIRGGSVTRASRHGFGIGDLALANRRSGIPAEIRGLTMRKLFSAVLFAAAAAACHSGNTLNQGGSSSSSSSGSGWIADGATACAKYLTPDVVAEILTHPAGHTKQLSAQACSYVNPDGNIDITLSNGGLATFEDYQKYLVEPVPLAGVGDKALRSVSGIVAVKGADRTCKIDAGGTPTFTKLSSAALADKLGAICNKLFALP